MKNNKELIFFVNYAKAVLPYENSFRKAVGLPTIKLEEVQLVGKDPSHQQRRYISG